MTKATHGNRAVKEYAERDKRVNEAIAMKIPDRVPVQLFVGYFAAKYCGIPFHQPIMIPKNGEQPISEQ